MVNTSEIQGPWETIQWFFVHGVSLLLHYIPTFTNVFKSISYKTCKMMSLCLIEAFLLLIMSTNLIN